MAAEISRSAWSLGCVGEACVGIQSCSQEADGQGEAERRPSYEKGLPCFPRRAEAHERGATSCQGRKATIRYARTAGGVPPRPGMGGTAGHGELRRLSRVRRKTAVAFGGAQGPSVETARDDSTGLPRCIPWRSSPSRSCTVISSSGENACGCYPFLSVEPRVGQAPARLRMQQANRRRFPGTWHPNLL